MNLQANLTPGIATAPALIVVIDASIALSATFRDEKWHARARQLLAALDAASARFIAPPLWESETSSVVRMRVETKKKTAPQDEARAYAFLDAMPIEIIHAPQTRQRARALAIQLGLNRAYDATYLALALEEGATFWTADERFYNIASPSFAAVKWLENWQDGDPIA